MQYLGFLSRRDPLYDFVNFEVQPELGLYGRRNYRVWRMHASNSVYLYEDEASHRRFIGKFFAPGGVDRARRHLAMENEFANLVFMRRIGFDHGYHYVARPLARNAALDELLVEECCWGESLSSVIIRSIREHNPALLGHKLASLAWFLAHFHNATANGMQVNFSAATTYAWGVTETLSRNGWISDHRRDKIGNLLLAWHDRANMWQDQEVVVHGDATPENFLLGDGMHVSSFDLERMRRADRLFDVGRLVAELAHFFMLYAGNRSAAEPAIGNFLWEYSCHFPDRLAAFRSITGRLPFYMGINFLRIARNSYFDWDYRQKLVNAGMECLKGGLA